ncbi:hypothetical protein [Mesobacterium pallidum]|uniref:hypothetical protein n=1 Tax=Mesobacterium pallidum TaxID=2872037 RepID=UPI001EE2B331|nr:hypothetical protein [Mesobacterium pallidum]
MSPAAVGRLFQADLRNRARDLRALTPRHRDLPQLGHGLFGLFPLACIVADPGDTG